MFLVPPLPHYGMPNRAFPRGESATAMYGKTSIEFPRRVVCLTAETAEIAFLVGAGDRVVGVPGTARRPEAAREKAKVGGFTTFKLEKILALEPDLVLAFSDLQRDIVRDLIGAGVSVLCTNQRSLDEVMEAILVICGAVGREGDARALVADIRDEIRQVREYSSVWPDPPRVYFEEWPDPPIAGIRWVSELIEIAGGRDVFAELRSERNAKERVVDLGEVARRDPEIILASWCGKPVDGSAIASRAGWSEVSAIRHGHVHEIDGADILLEYRVNEELVLEEGVVKKASRHVSQGAGVRAQAGTRTGYAHTDAITLHNLEEAARQARAIADRASGTTALATTGAGKPHDLYALDEPPIVTDLAKKLDLLRKVDAAARAADPRIRQVIASIASEEVVTLIATITGWTVGDVRPLTRLNVTTIAEENGKREIGTYGGGGRVRFDFFLEDERW